MKLIGKALAFGFAVATASVVACSTGPHSTPAGSQETSPGVENGTGEVGFQYTLPGGEHISTVKYTLTDGTAAHTYSNTVTVGASSIISFVIGGVAAGGGYSISLTATSDDGLVSCSGSNGTGLSDAGQNNGAPFIVANRTTTVVNVQMICIDVPNQSQGNVLVNGIPSCCATWDTIVANPQGTLLTTAPGNSAVLTGNASGPCDGDAGFGVNLNCTWTRTAGTGTVGATTTDGKGNFSATFTCGTAMEQDTIALDCTDGPLPDGGFCPSSLTHGEINIICGAKPACSNAGESGVEASPDTALGTCTGNAPGGNPFVNSGVADQDGNFCCVPACNGGPVASPFTGTGTCTGGLVNNGLGCCVSLLPCTQAGQANCVTCANNTKAGANGITAVGQCTTTEARLVQHDINKHLATAPGADPAGSCYACMAQKGCIDQTKLSTVGHECDDTSTITTGTGAQCLSVVDCIFSSACSGTQTSDCYCGSAPALTTCSATPSAANGLCDTQIAAGFGVPVTDGVTISSDFTITSFASGMADALFNCAVNGGCTACLN